MSVDPLWLARAVRVVDAVGSVLGTKGSYTNNLGVHGPAVRWRTPGHSLVAEVCFAAPFGEVDAYEQALIDALEKHDAEKTP